MTDSPRVRVTVPVANAAARRLTSAANVNAVLGQGSTVDQALLESAIDRVSAQCAEYCNLAKDIAGALPTFGAETLEATWLATNCSRDHELLLPWRVPVTSISSVGEDGVTLSSTDYQTKAGGILERICSDAPMCWSSRKIVVVYVAGWSLPANVPPDLEGQVIEQVKYAYKSRARDGSIRSKSVPDLYSVSYAVPGGDSIGESGLFLPLERALDSYRAQAL